MSIATTTTAAPRIADHERAALEAFLVTVPAPPSLWLTRAERLLLSLLQALAYEDERHAAQAWHTELLEHERDAALDRVADLLEVVKALAPLQEG